MSIDSTRNYSSPYDKYSQPTPIAKEKIEIARKRLLKRVGGMGNLPGLSHVLSVPLKAGGDIRSVYTAVKVKDRDSIFHTILRLFQNSTAYFSGLASLMVYLERIFSNLSHYLPKGVELGGAILGLVSCALEATIEGFDFVRASLFRRSPLMQFAKFLIAHEGTLRQDCLSFAKELEEKQLPHILKYLTQEESTTIQKLLYEIKSTNYTPWAVTCAEDLERISMATLTRSFADKYFDDVDFAKQLSLERIVGTPACEDLDSELYVLSGYINNYGCCQEELAAARDLFQFLDDQAFKKQIVNIIGFCAAVVTGVAIGLGMFTGIGTAVLVTIIVLGIALSLARYAYLNGVHSHKGWHFDWKACLPDCIQKKIEKLREKHLAAA